MTGRYRPGSSPLHRAPAGAKLLALLALAVLLALGGRTALPVAAGAALCAGGHLLAGFGPRGLARQVWAARWVALVTVLAQAAFRPWQETALVTGYVVELVVAAGLVTSTTRVTDMLDALTGVLAPLRRAGVDPDRIGLVLALAVSALPVVSALLCDVRDAVRARGCGGGVAAWSVPLIVGALKRADEFADALDATD